MLKVFKEGMFDSGLTPELAILIHKVVTGMTVVFMGFMSAKLVTTGISTFIGPSEVSSLPKATNNRSGKKLYKEAKRDEYDAIISRNLFNSKNEIPDDDIRSVGDESTDLAKRSTLGIELIGTIVVNDPMRSVAAISIKARNKVEPFRVSDVVLSKATIVKIAKTKVILKNNISGDLEYIEFKEKKTGRPATTKISTKGGLRKLDEDHMIVDRSFVDNAISNLNQILTQARAVPYTENGRIAGWRLFDIVPGSIYSKIGAKNGDIIRSVNGTQMTDPAKGMELFGQLRTNSHFEINVTRRGENKTLIFDIQ